MMMRLVIETRRRAAWFAEYLATEIGVSQQEIHPATMTRTADAAD